MAAARKHNYPAERAPRVKGADPSEVARFARQLRAATRRVEANEAIKQRDELVRRAHAAGLTPRQIQEFTGLSPQRIWQITRGRRA